MKENIQCLENLSKKLGETIDKLKSSYEEINKNKEELKLKIQKIFTKIRNSLNEREDKLISEVDKEFDDLFFKEDILKNIEKLPNKIKIYLEKGKILDNDWKDENKLYSLINDSINIENNIKEIKNVFENAKKINNLNDINIDFFEEEYNIDKILEIINIFGNINHYNKNYQYKFKNWPKNKNENQKFFNISGEGNIFTVTSKNNEWIGVICENKLEKNKEYKWKIKILKTLNNIFL